MHGGNGYIEDFVTPRLLRDAQVLTVWEGTANILGLEVLRLMNKFKGHEIFIKKMNEELANVPDELKELKEMIEEELKALEQWTSTVAAAPHDVQTFHSKRIAKMMSDVFESIIVLWEAAAGGLRERHKAEIFIQQALQPAAMDMEMKTVRYFDEIVRWNSSKEEVGS